MADRVNVMYAGKVVESGTANEVFFKPAHPYTWALLSSIPDLQTKERLLSISGTPPNMIHPPRGDAFSVRNKHALKIDFEMEPPLFRISDTHYAATWLLHPKAKQVKIPEVLQARIDRMKDRGILNG
jgi:oligopeptide transport system ATP-binding protein